jgi:chorismate--pyruvate lyase
LRHGSGAEAYFDWLAHVGSLTARLRARCPAFRVRLLRQELAPAGRDERAPLGLAAREFAWVREVVLYCAEAPVVFAHTVLPRTSVRGAWHLFGGLGTRPLGAILFSDPLIERRPFDYRRLDARHPLYHPAAAACAAPGPLWARRSLFCRNGRPLLLTEVFLPAILDIRP